MKTRIEQTTTMFEDENGPPLSTSLKLENVNILQNSTFLVKVYIGMFLNNCLNNVGYIIYMSFTVSHPIHLLYPVSILTDST